MPVYAKLSEVRDGRTRRGTRFDLACKGTNVQSSKGKCLFPTVGLLHAFVSNMKAVLEAMNMQGRKYNAYTCVLEDVKANNKETTHSSRHQEGISNVLLASQVDHRHLMAFPADAAAAAAAGVLRS